MKNFLIIIVVILLLGGGIMLLKSLSGDALLENVGQAVSPIEQQTVE